MGRGEGRSKARGVQANCPFLFGTVFGDPARSIRFQGSIAAAAMMD
jgi:hypothetical protein